MIMSQVNHKLTQKESQQEACFEEVFLAESSNSAAEEETF